MADNIFEKVDKQSEMLDSIVANQKQQSELLHQILGQMQSPKAAPQSGATPMNAQIQRENEKLTLQRFIRAATKTYHYLGDVGEYQKEKSKALVLLVLTITVGIIANILTGVSAGLFSTFSLIEDLWFFLVFRMICYVVHSKRFYDHIDYSAHSFETFAMNADGLYCPQKTKLSYRIIKILALISTPCNIIFLCTHYQGAITIFAIIFEVLAFAAVFFSLYVAEGFFCQYSLVFFTGKKENGNETVTLVFDKTFRQLYLKEEYEKKFPFAK